MADKGQNAEKKARDDIKKAKLDDLKTARDLLGKIKIGIIKVQDDLANLPDKYKQQYSSLVTSLQQAEREADQGFTSAHSAYKNELNPVADPNAPAEFDDDDLAEVYDEPDVGEMPVDGPEEGLESMDAGQSTPTAGDISEI